MFYFQISYLWIPVNYWLSILLTAGPYSGQCRYVVLQYQFSGYPNCSPLLENKIWDNNYKAWNVQHVAVELITRTFWDCHVMLRYHHSQGISLKAELKYRPCLWICESCARNKLANFRANSGANRCRDRRATGLERFWADLLNIKSVWYFRSSVTFRWPVIG